jgi:hypothetical protein
MVLSCHLLVRNGKKWQNVVEILWFAINVIFLSVSLPVAAHLHLNVMFLSRRTSPSQQILTSSPVVRDGMPSARVALFVA